MSARSQTLPQLLNALSQAGVDFVVCGGVACVLHGVNRVTADLDICVELEEENLRRLIDLAGELGLSPRNPEPIERLLDPAARREWIEKKGAEVFTLTGEGTTPQVDIFLRYPVEFADLKARGQRMVINGESITISSREDLIFAKSKVTPMRETDRRDIEDLKRLIDQ